MSQKDVLRQALAHKLEQEHCFWSFDMSQSQEIPDCILIEKTMIYLDIKEIDTLFEIFSYNKIKSVWLERLIPQEDYLYNLNRFFAWYYFKAKRPDTYIKAMATRHFNRMSS